MLSGIRVFSSDSSWCHILSDFGAVLVDDVALSDVDIDALHLQLPVSAMELKAAIIAETDNNKILTKIFSHHVNLSPIQTQIIVRLYKSGGMSGDELKMALGYAENARTHTVETAVYGLRKMFGHEFIKNENGIFRLGGV